MKSWLRGTEYFPSAKQRIKNSFIAGEIRLQKKYDAPEKKGLGHDR